jgi:pyruvate/2-oxoglutarate/acetoin dehydrogenase E1 component
VQDRTLTYAAAIQEATAQEMARDDSVVLFGEGAHLGKITYGTTEGLVDKFGEGRVFDTPLSEDGMTGIAVGMALGGLRPIHFHQRMDFVLLAMNQIVNIAAKSRYMFGGQVSVPLVIRSVIGRSWGQGSQHSQALQSLFMHFPGLKVVAPTTPYDAKGCLTQSIRDDNPVLFIEHRMLHYLKGYVPADNYTVPFGKARVLAEGQDVTLVGISYMAVECIRAQHQLAEVGLRAEVIDPVCLSPLDIETIVNSVRKTGRLVVVDSAWLMCGAAAEIVTQVVERIQGERDVRVRRMGFEPVPCPTSKNLETLFYPNAQTIAATVYGLVCNNGEPWMPAATEAPEIVEFKGPF